MSLRPNWIHLWSFLGNVKSFSKKKSWETFRLLTSTATSSITCPMLCLNYQINTKTFLIPKIWWGGWKSSTGLTGFEIKLRVGTTKKRLSLQKTSTLDCVSHLTLIVLQKFIKKMCELIFISDVLLSKIWRSQTIDWRDCPSYRQYLCSEVAFHNYDLYCYLISPLILTWLWDLISRWLDFVTFKQILNYIQFCFLIKPEYQVISLITNRWCWKTTLKQFMVGKCLLFLTKKIIGNLYVVWNLAFLSFTGREISHVRTMMITNIFFITKSQKLLMYS